MPHQYLNKMWILLLLKNIVIKCQSAQFCFSHCLGLLHTYMLCGCSVNACEENSAVHNWLCIHLLDSPFYQLYSHVLWAIVALCGHCFSSYVNIYYIYYGENYHMQIILFESKTFCSSQITYTSLGADKTGSWSITCFEKESCNLVSTMWLFRKTN